MESHVRRCVRLFALVVVAPTLLVASHVAYAAVGRTVGNFSVSSTGAAEYTIPLWTPPGINGMQPLLSLAYSSRKGSGIFGVGWSLEGLSSIHRCQKTWVQDGVARDVRNDSLDRFCLDGNQLKLASGTYGAAGSTYQTEIDTFTRVTAYSSAGNGPAYFIAEGKDGLYYRYGYNANSRIESLGQTTVRAWALDRISDRAGSTMFTGNSVLISYIEDAVNGSYRPSTIDYSENLTAGISAHYRVTFVSEPDPAGEIDASYFAGSQVNRVVRIDKIDITNDSALVRRYDLTYEAALSSTNKSRLASIQECSGSGDCFPTSTFAYQNGTPGLGSEAATGISLPLAGNDNPWTLDVNGDGRKDLAYSSTATSGTGVWMVALANTSGGYGTPINTGITNTNFAGATSIDYNGDGLEDLIVPYSGGTWWAMLGTSSGLAAPTNTLAPTTTTGTGYRARGIDIDGDGRQDLVWADIVGVAGGDAIRYRLRLSSGGFSSTVNTLVGPMPAGSYI